MKQQENVSIARSLPCIFAMCCALLCACAQQPEEKAPEESAPRIHAPSKESEWAVTESEHSEIVADLNAGSYFGGYALGQPYDGPGDYSNPFAETSNGAVSIGSFGVPPPIDIVDANGHLALSVHYGYYPVGSNEPVVSELVVRNGEYHVFGISVGDDIDESVQKLLLEGYTEPDADENYGLRLRSNSVYQYRLLRLGNVLIVLQTYYRSGPSVFEIEVHLWTDDEDSGDPGMIW